jgi:hypothetical protein
MQPRRPPGGFRTRRPNKAISYSRRSQKRWGTGPSRGQNLKRRQGKSAFVADTLATAYFANGQVEKALTQERAMALAKDTLIETGRSAKDRLEQYKKAAKK